MPFNTVDTILMLTEKGAALEIEETTSLASQVRALFRQVMKTAAYDGRAVTSLITKLRDSGRRSPPWKATSSRVPGRPQDGSDGNRTKRWLLAEGHKFFADQRTATLVEVKYYLQLLSMTGAPPLPDALHHAFDWLLGHPLLPGAYLDPIQQVPILLPEVVAGTTLIQSGHLIPLDRGGRHEPANTFLMLSRSNQLQGNLPLDELLQLMRDIVARHHTT